MHLQHLSPGTPCPGVKESNAGTVAVTGEEAWATGEEAWATGDEGWATGEEAWATGEGKASTGSR